MRANDLIVSSSDDNGYVHDPAAFDADADSEQGGEPVVEGDEPPHPATVDREFDWRGWILIGVLCFAFLVAPTAIYLVPPGAEGIASRC